MWMVTLSRIHRNYIQIYMFSVVKKRLSVKVNSPIKTSYVSYLHYHRDTFIFNIFYVTKLWYNLLFYHVSLPVRLEQRPCSLHEAGFTKALSTVNQPGQHLHLVSVMCQCSYKVERGTNSL